MVGISVRRKPDGLILYKGAKNAGSGLPTNGVCVEIFLDRDECNKVASTIWEARREHWKKEEKGT